MPQPTPSDGPLTASHVPAPAGRSEAETLAPAAVPGGATPPESVPGYEVLSELGRGGMGVVYKARQVAADRVVALKMILHGGHAGEDALARFRTEAKAIARLQHPNIVQVYEVGEHDGLPFFSLEFCPGGSLERKLAGTPLPAREAARLVEVLARAMHAAHRAQIIHRDLKPANVLLAADGTPKVTDFGLAKQLGAAAGPTQSNAFMGTPSYAAPEQAAGNWAAVGPATDTYALGAILYECLTGRPPFKGPTTFDTLMQVLTDDPVPPRQLQSTTPKDLETICLKCLHKEPARRYATAEALAEDLRRFQAGEPILARPVGSLERAIKWVRRRPTVSALLAAAVMLAAATVGSILYAFRQDAARQSEIANQERENTREQLRLTKEAQDESNKAKAARAEVEATLARSLLRALGNQGSIVNDTELEALWELAESSNPRVHQLFIESALARPFTTLQLRSRRELAVHAAVGLDPARRQRLEELLLQRLRDETADPKWRENCAWVALELGGPGRELTNAAARPLADALAKETDYSVLYELAKALKATAERLGPVEAEGVARGLADALAKEASGIARPHLEGALMAVTPRLGPAEAAGLAQPLADALAKETNQTARSRLVAALKAVTPRLGPAEAGVVVRPLADALARETNPTTRLPLVNALVVVASRLEPAESAQLLAGTLTEETDPTARSHLAWALRLAATRMDQAEAAPLVRRLADGWGGETNATMRSRLVEALGAVTPLMDQAEAEAVARRLADGLDTEKDPVARVALAGALGRVAAERLGPAEAAQLLADALAKEKGPIARSRLAGALQVAAARLGQAEAEAVARRLADAMTRETDRYAQSEMAETLAAVAAWMDQAEAAHLAAETGRLLADALAKETNQTARSRLLDALGAVAHRMDQAEAEAVARRLADSLDTEKDAAVVIKLAGALGAAAARLGPAEADALAGRLADALAKEREPFARSRLASALGAVAARMGPTEAEAVARRLTDALGAETDPGARYVLVGALGAVTERLGPAEVATLAGRLAEPLGRATAMEVGWAKVLGTVAARMKPDDAAAFAGRLAGALVKEANWNTRSNLASALAVVAARLAPAEAAALTRPLADALGTEKDPGVRASLAKALGAVAARMDPAEAAALAGHLADALAKDKDLTAPYVRSALATALGEAVSRMDPAEAARLLANVLAEETFTAAQSQLAEALRAVATRIEPGEVAPRSLLAAQAVTGGITPAPQLGQAVTLLRAAEPLPCRFTTQQLVDFLKMPTCVGRFRTVILELLGNRYHRAFADQWEFVEFAEKNLPDIDLKSPPKRPGK
jgi:hypothetical protein